MEAIIQPDDQGYHIDIDLGDVSAQSADEIRRGVQSYLDLIQDVEKEET